MNPFLRYIIISMLALSGAFQFLSAQIICIKCFKQNARITNPISDHIVNGSFENTTCSGSFGNICPNSTNYQCNVSNWICTGGGTSTYASVVDNSFSFIANGSLCVYLGNFYCNACSNTVNDTSCLVKSDCEISGVPSGFPMNTAEYGNGIGVSFEQTVTGLVVGNAYVLEFWTGGEDGSGYFTQDGIFGVDIGFGYNMFKCQPTSINPPDNIGTRFIIEFWATSTSHTIKFTNWGHICSSCTELILDDVTLYPLTELPASIEPCTVIPPVVPDSLHIPNVFTPNDDGTNDMFEVFYNGIKDYNIIIYNRWGEPVFTSHDKSKHWNGKINNAFASEGTYYFLLTLGDKVYKNFLTLFR